MRTIVVLFCSATLFAQSGEWQVTILRFGSPDHNRATLEFQGEKITGKSGNLQLEGTLRGGRVELEAKRPDGKSAGKFSGVLRTGEMSGEAIMGEDKFTWNARRIPDRPGAPSTHHFTPTLFHRYFSGMTPAALRIFPGDTVETWSVDAGGRDAQGARRVMGGNPLTGPFYVEGALPGDTLVVRFDRVRLNRDSAGSGDRLVPSALNPGYFARLKNVEDFDSHWTLDRERGVAMLAKPTEKLKAFTVKLKPMLGCVGVAPPQDQSFRSGWLGNWGGNMDYNQVGEGTTVYLPVFQPGALLFVGDGHAAQGDGELTGDALETSMEFTFTVNVIPGKRINNPRMENPEYRMASGIENSLPEALAQATTNLARWLEDDYKLNANEVAIVLGTSIRYDIAEVVDPQVHVVAKIAKSVLAQIQ